MMRSNQTANLRRIGETIIGSLILLLLAAIFLLPLLWMFFNAFKTPSQLAQYPPTWWPSPWTLRAFEEGFGAMNFLKYIGNTGYIAIMCVIGNLLSCTLVAFGFAKFKAKGKNVLFMILLSTMMVPVTVTLLPTYAIYSQLGFLNTYIPLIAPAFFGASTFNIFLLRQFFAAMPNELGESAMIDGAGWFRIFYTIYIPNAKPVLLVVIVNTIVFAWNDYLAPMIYLVNPSKYTIAIGLHSFKVQFGGVMDVGPLMAISLLSILPVLLFFILFQKYFIEGIVSSGIKG
jgi:multiple sugar transport system permease protein